MVITIDHLDVCRHNLVYLHVFFPLADEASDTPAAAQYFLLWSKTYTRSQRERGYLLYVSPPCRTTWFLLGEHVLL